MSELETSASARADCSFTDRGDVAALQASRRRDGALLAQARETLVEVEGALARLDNDRFGVGLTTGAPIPLARLEAVPWARD